MIFTDRTHAGKLLAEKLNQYLPTRPEFDRSRLLVVGLPRGGVPVALEVARKFGCPLEIIVSKKLPFPSRPEYAIGAVSSDGITVLSPGIPHNRQWRDYIEEQRRDLLERTQIAEERFYALAGYQQSSFKNKTVIIVDDGIATGMTAMAAADSARQRGAAHTIVAAPVMSVDSIREIGSHCDEVIAVSVPTEFLAVGQHYRRFDQTTDEEVVQAMREATRLVTHHESGPQSSGTRPSMFNWRIQ